MDGKMIALTLVLVIVAVLCAWIVSTALTGSEMVDSSSIKVSRDRTVALSMSIGKNAEPLVSPVILSMSIVEPNGVIGGE
ncbi:hypothetical protein KY335_01935 [Candidatus Woesearchaeota archaeon]|nr:hypothetical protein [Candidatus Woesearchaeota archaeon]